MNRSWVRFPQAAQMRPPGSGWAFSYARVVLRCWLWIVAPLVFRVLLVCLGRAALCARGRRPAREIATREPSARSDRSRSPARPCRRPRAPQPGPAAAHGHRSLAPPSPTGAAAWPCHRPRAPLPGPPDPPVPSTPVGLCRCEQPGPRHHPRAPLPGPGLLYVAQWWLSIINFACNSPVACSNIEFASLELQRFLGLLKFGPIELHAKFIWS